jgi:cell wall-associated NlpC family hydrolase
MLMWMTAPRHTLTLLALAAGVLAASACASHTPGIRVLPPRTAPGVEQKAPPGTVEWPSSAGDVTGSAIARTAETLLGSPYREGGALPGGFDCSGLVNYVFARHGIAVPRDVSHLASAGVPVDRGDIAPGDLVFFAINGSGPTHVGIAIGDGRFVHAPKSGDVVRVESMSAGYWTSRFVAARRLSIPGV